MAEFTPEQVKAAAAELRDWDGYFLSHGFSTKHVTAPADMLSAYAERLTQTCETCNRAGKVDYAMGERVRQCWLGLFAQITHNDETTCNWVPLAVNGRPFSCAGWQAKETR